MAASTPRKSRRRFVVCVSNDGYTASLEVRKIYTALRDAVAEKSTVHYWARNGVLAPSVSSERVKLWSFADLLALRTIYWLRHEKEADDGDSVPAASMPAVRRALAMLQELSLDLFSIDGASRVVVDRTGEIIVRSDGGLARPNSGQGVLEVLDLIAPFPTQRGARGPDLREPRPHLRIVPGKLSGEPHVTETRLETQALAALARRGVSVTEILVLYPFVDRVAVEEALDLEDQLKTQKDFDTIKPYLKEAYEVSLEQPQR